ncbi:serotransferrin-like [Abrus precatorius]|uniref:Serotransferrin-like n=1 Tax=Abrus precatorius TaxID=3816 RepID=A0A8B8MA34_ABRPR|nr:serotransferrin-like [Abrus precatorius]
MKMQIPTTTLALFLLFSLNSLLLSSSFIQGFQPLPAPSSSDDHDFRSPLSPPTLPPVAADGGADGSPSGEPVPPSQVVIGKWHQGSPGAPAPISENGVVGSGNESSGEVAPSSPATDDGGVRWCAVRDEVEECRFFVSVINQIMGYTWKCVQRDKAQGCVESIKKGEADLVNLEAGLAYYAFINHSMKAIANEIYCDHSNTYEAVAVVNRRACENNVKITLMDFKGHKSCHGGYSTAAGWNYPINYIKKFINNEKLSDKEIATSFFSDVCAPSEVEGFDICNACRKENETCHEIGLYSGHSGAFRCLIEELGDIAFVKGDTALLYSMEGPHSQLWSTKSVRDFMYLCPQGGCREINGYPGDCSFGAVPANVIMAHNSMPNKKKKHVLETLMNTSLVDTLYASNDVRSHLFSPSTQGIAMIEKATRLYLGKSASISQSIQKLNAPEARVTSYAADNGSDESSSSSCICCSQLMAMLSLLMLQLLLGILTPK